MKKIILNFSITSLLIISIMRIFNILPSFLGLFLIIINSYLFFICLEPILKKTRIESNLFSKIVFLLSYYSISLSIIYYTLGLNQISISFWLLFNYIILYIYNFRKITEIKLNLNKIKNNIADLRKPITIFIFLSLLSIIIIFFLMPITDGNPSPWPKNVFTILLLLFILSLILIKRLILEKRDLIISFLYLFITVCLVAMRHVLSYGYDTLIHQGALKYILENGKILPLSPFYIGQYSLEIIINVFTSFSFTFIERWLGPLMFILLIFLGGNYLLERLKIKKKYFLIPLSAIILIPNVFYATSPYALSLLWGIISVIFIFLFIKEKKQTDINLSILCSVTSFFIHPFVGLNILFWSLIFFILNKKNVKKFKKIIIIFSFLISSVIVPLAFIFFNWLKDVEINIYNPIYLIINFANTFSDPAWYIKYEYPWWLGLIYFYEKISFFLIFFILLYFPFKKMELAKNYIIMISFSLLISAWIFVSGFDIENYFYGDQINYAHRLIQASKWVLWPIFLILIVEIFKKIQKMKEIKKYLLILLLSIILTTSVYLTYPRQDAISQMNVNSIRSIDYKAIKLINEQENGKDGYLVLSNQIIGAGAISLYGFGPYYKVGKEEIFYYSLPWGSKLSNIYNEIMNLESGSIKKELEKIEEVIEEININRVYIVYTDAWSPPKNSSKQIKKIAESYWNVDNKVFIYLIKFHR